MSERQKTGLSQVLKRKSGITAETETTPLFSSENIPEDPADERLEIADLPEEKKRALEQYADEMVNYIRSADYEEHLRLRGYSDGEIRIRRQEALEGLRDVLKAGSNLRSFAVVFASSPPEELRRKHLTQKDIQTATKWYSYYSAMLEATTLYEAVYKRGLEPNSDLVDKLMVGTAYSFGHTSRRTGVMPNYFATRSILTSTLNALDEIAKERIERGEAPNTREALKDLANNPRLQRRLVEHVLVEAGITDWADEQKSRVKTEIRVSSKASDKGETATKVVLGVVPSQKSTEEWEREQKRKEYLSEVKAAEKKGLPTSEPPAELKEPPTKQTSNIDEMFNRMRGNIIGGVWSMVNAVRSNDVTDAVRNGAVPFSDKAKKTLNYSFQILHSQRLGGVEGRQHLPHDPLTVRDVWETAGTLGQLRVITDAIDAGDTVIHGRLNTEHLNNIFVPLGFRVGYDEKKNQYTVTPIDAVWQHIANNPDELRLYHDLAKNIIPSSTHTAIPLFEELPTEYKATKSDISAEYQKGIPIFRSIKGTASSFLILKTPEKTENAERLKKTIANAIAKHLNALHDLTQTITIGTDKTPSGNRYWIGFNAEQAKQIANRFGFDPMEMVAFENNGATVIRDQQGGVAEIRFYEDEAKKLFDAEATNAKLHRRLDLFAKFVEKAITGNPNMFSGFAPALVETYTTADEQYRENIRVLRQQMEAELPSETQPKTTLKQRLKTMLTPQGEKAPPTTQTTQAQCWVAYRNAVLSMGAFK